MQIVETCFQAGPIKKKGAGHILVIRLDAIGDFILWLDAAKEFRNIYPTHKITLLGNQAWADLAKELPYWDEVWGLDRRRFKWDLIYRWKILQKVRKAHFEIVIQPTFSREFRYGDSIIRASGAQNRIGSVGDFANIKPWAKKISDKWYTHLMGATHKPLMELSRNAEFIRGLGRKEFKSNVPILTLDHKSITFNENIPQKSYIISPGASTAFKQWPTDRFVLLIEKIFKHTGLSGILCGGYREKKIAKKIISQASAPLLNFTGKTSLVDLAHVIKNVYFLVGNDTSAIHIAAAVNTRSICVMGGGHFGRFLPYKVEQKSDGYFPIPVAHAMECFNCNWEGACLSKFASKKVAPCINNITVKDVWEKIENKILNTDSIEHYE